MTPIFTFAAIFTGEDIKPNFKNIQMDSRAPVRK